MVKAMQVVITQPPVPYQPAQVRPQQLYTPTTAVTPGQFDISTLLTSIMPLIMLVLMFQMLRPMLSGMAGK